MLSRKFATPFLALLLLLLLSLAMYFPALGFSYVWDDTLLFLDKTALLNDSLSWELLSSPVLPGTSYLRPFVFLTFYIEFQLFGQSPVVSHGINLAIFLINVSLLFFVARRVSLAVNRTSWAIPFVTSILYAMHPALIESVAWVSGRFDLLVTTFILLSVFVFLGSYVCWARNLILALLMLGGLFSKELAFVLPVVLFCIWVACNAAPQTETALQTFVRGLKENFGLFLVLALTFFLYLCVRAGTENGVYHAGMSKEYISSIWLEGLLPLEALKFYFMQTFIPFSNVNPQHPIEELAPWSVESLAASAALLIFIVLWFAYAWRHRTVSAWLGLAGLICILPVTHLIPLSISENVGHERFMTTALAFFCIAITLLPYDKLFEKIKVRVNNTKKITALLLVGWLSLAAWTVSTVLPFWSSDLQLWNWAHSVHPEMEAARYNYLYGALQEGRLDLVEEAIAKLHEKDGSLDVGDQLLYAHALFRRGDSESMSYLQGVLFALPEFHAMTDGHKIVDVFHMTAAQMAGAYSLYSMGVLVFHGDAESALKYNDIGMWYLKDSELIPMKYQRAAILYALGRAEKADFTVQEQELLGYYMKDSARLMLKQILIKYCALESSNDMSCEEIRRRGLIDANDV